jgi:hypothetical protein
MGQDLSSVRSPEDLKDLVTDKLGLNKDPCKPDLDTYLKCVQSKTNGLTEGDDCTAEAIVYKNCRAANKDWKN